LILRGRRFGFSLEEIRQWLLIYETRGSKAQYQTFVVNSGRQLAELERQRDELDQTIADLRALRDETQQIVDRSES